MEGGWRVIAGAASARAKPFHAEAEGSGMAMRRAKRPMRHSARAHLDALEAEEVALLKGQRRLRGRGRVEPARERGLHLGKGGRAEERVVEVEDEAELARAAGRRGGGGGLRVR